MKEFQLRAWDIENKKMLSHRETIELIYEWNGSFEIDGYEIMQHNGLKDKKMKKIFEGDILINDMNDKTVVSSDLDWNCGCCNNVYGWQFDQDTELLEIIGNVYQNPELLKEDKLLTK